MLIKYKNSRNKRAKRTNRIAARKPESEFIMGFDKTRIYLKVDPKKLLITCFKVDAGDEGEK